MTLLSESKDVQITKTHRRQSFRATLLLICKSGLAWEKRKDTQETKGSIKPAGLRPSQPNALKNNWRRLYISIEDIFDSLLWRRGRNKWYCSLQIWNRSGARLFEPWFLLRDRATFFKPWCDWRLGIMAGNRQLHRGKSWVQTCVDLKVQTPLFGTGLNWIRSCKFLRTIFCSFKFIRSCNFARL